jgi:hypothetical protein
MLVWTHHTISLITSFCSVWHFKYATRGYHKIFPTPQSFLRFLILRKATSSSFKASGTYSWPHYWFILFHPYLRSKHHTLYLTASSVSPILQGYYHHVDSWRNFKDNSRNTLPIKESYPCNMLWRAIKQWNVEDPTLSRKSAYRWLWGCQI